MTKVWLLIHFLIIISMLGSYAHASGNDILKIRHPVNSENSIYRQRDEYFLAQLKLALQLAEQNYQLIPSPVPTMPEGRSVALINDGYYNVHWMSTSESREENLLPIKIPLDKGLIGWRLMLIHASSSQRFDRIDTLSALQSLTAGVGHDWPDVAVLRNNGFRFSAASSTESLQQMLSFKRIDYFPRSVLEIWQELAISEHPNLVIEQNYALQYPAAIYFFVANDNRDLHDTIKTGLALAIKSGQFDALFNEYFVGMINKARLDQRRVFRLDNPLINDQEYLSQDELWFTPGKVQPTDAAKTLN